MASIISVSDIVFFIFLLINTIILLLALYYKLRYKCEFFKTMKSAYTVFASFVYYKGTFAGTCILWVLSLLIIINTLSINTNTFYKGLESQNSGTHYYTIAVNHKKGTYYFPVEIELEVDVYEDERERTKVYKTYYLKKIYCDEDKTLTPITEDKEITIGSETLCEFFDNSNKELMLNVTLINHPSHLEYEINKKHDIFLDMQTIYLLICIYIISISPRKSLDEL